MEVRKKEVLRVEGLVKYYDAERALAGISLGLEPGCVLGLVGENGAGKSTFAKCLMGFTRPTSGSICLEPGVRIGWIPQEFNLVAHLSVAENIFLGCEPVRLGMLDRTAMRAEAKLRLDRLGAGIDPDALVGELPPAGKQMVEFAKAFDGKCRILIMDEPTTILNNEETARLFGIMREFKDGGGSIIFISHKLPEVLEICDEIAVLRDGELVCRTPSHELDAPEIARRMVGRELSRLFPDPPTAEPGEIALEAEGIASGKEVKDVTFSLRRGEILGVAGLAGAGRTELAEAIMGLRKIEGGILKINGRERKFNSVSQAVAAGLSYLPEDRQGSGVLPDFSIEENITLNSLARYSCGLLKRGAIREAAEKFIARFHIKPDRAGARLSELSGGNQQKVAIAKNLDTNPGIFIFDEPTRGVDVGARREIYDFIRDCAGAGMACMLISSDMEEILGMCPRVMVMRGGRMAGFLEGDQLNQQNLMYLAIGVEQQ